MRYLTIIAMSLFLFGSAFAMDEGSMEHEAIVGWAFADWDTNDDDRVGSEEFSTAFEEDDLFEHWDDNGDGSLQGGEFSQGLFALWDDDADGYLAADEIEAKGFWDWSRHSE